MVTATNLEVDNEMDVGEVRSSWGHSSVESFGD